MRGFGFIQPKDLEVRRQIGYGKDLFFHMGGGIFPDGVDKMKIDLSYGTEVVFILGRSKNMRLKAEYWTLKEYAMLLQEFERTRKDKVMLES